MNDAAAACARCRGSVMVDRRTEDVFCLQCGDRPADRAAGAVDLSARVARDALRRVVAAQELERRRLARELHDEYVKRFSKMGFFRAPRERYVLAGKVDPDAGNKQPKQRQLHVVALERFPQPPKAVRRCLLAGRVA